MPRTDYNTDDSALSARVAKFYNLPESRVGYKLLLDDCTHKPFYESTNSPPFPVAKALDAMRQVMFKALNLEREGNEPGPLILDAGCGTGHVAKYMVKQGLRVDCIDIVPKFVEKTRQLMFKNHLQGAMTVKFGNFEKLDQQPLNVADNYYSGIIHMESFCYATDPVETLKGYLRVLKPGKRIVIHDYDFGDVRDSSRQMQKGLALLAKATCATQLNTQEPKWIQNALAEAGFVDIRTKNYTDNTVPMMRFWYYLAVAPYNVFRVLGLRRFFPNTVCAVIEWKNSNAWKYVQVVGTKPGPSQTRLSAGRD